MEGFIRLIAKESIFPDMASECGAMDQIGMEDQCIPLGLISFSIAVNARHLARCKENQRALLVIISMPPIYQVAAFYVLQKNSVKPKIHARALPRVGF